jgi:hypothetical protein
VIGELDFIKTMTLFSDKCNIKDIEKMEKDYAKDLQKRRFDTKSRLYRYIKIPDRVPPVGGATAQVEDDKP